MTATAAGREAVSPAQVVRRLRPLLAVLRPHRRLMAATLVAGLAAQLLAVAAGVLGAHLVGRAATGTPAAELVPELWLLVALVVPQAVLAYGESLVSHVAAFRALADLRRRVYATFERLAPAGLQTRRSGDLAATAMSDIELLETFFAHTIVPLAVSVLVPAAGLVALAALSWPLALVLAPFVIAVGTLPGWLRRVSVRQGEAERRANGELSAVLVDSVQGVREVVAHGAADRQRATLRHRGDLLQAARVAHARRSGLERGLVDLLAGAGVLAVLATAAVLHADGRLAGALLPTVAVLAGAAFAPVLLFSTAARELGRVGAASERLQALLVAPVPVPDTATPRRRPARRGSPSATSASATAPTCRWRSTG